MDADRSDILRIGRTLRPNDVQYLLVKKLDFNDQFVFIIVNEYSQVHITATVSSTHPHDNGKPANEQRRDVPSSSLPPAKTYSTYQFLKFRNPNVIIYKAFLNESTGFGHQQRVEQYFFVNSKFQIQLVYPLYSDTEERQRYIDKIQQKYRIEYILESEKYLKVHHLSHEDQGIIEFKSEFNIIQEKKLLFTQLNQKQDWTLFDRDIVVQLVVDGNRQQIVYV